MAMKWLQHSVPLFDKLSMKDLDLRHKIQIIFGVISLIPLAVFSYILLSANVSLGTNRWLLVSLSVLLALFGLELLHATIEEINHKNTMNRRLIQSERLASVGRLAAGVAHEILNPVNVISGRAQLLLMDRNIDPQVSKTVKIIYDQTKRVAAVVNNLRQFSSKSKDGKNLLDIHELLERILNLLEYEMRVNNLEIVRRFDSATPYVLGRNDELGQGFLNIISNAAEAMPDGGTLTISTRIIQRPDARIVEIRFSDTSSGVSEETVDRLFDPFFTADENGLRTGLGLFVSYGIIENHGGTIWVDTSAQNGLTLVVGLPMLQPQEESPNALNHPHRPPVLSTSPVIEEAYHQPIR
jgi:signal transduction histidine kinase